jgi:hypothetical protein
MAETQAIDAQAHTKSFMLSSQSRPVLSQISPKNIENTRFCMNRAMLLCRSLQHYNPAYQVPVSKS